MHDEEFLVFFAVIISAFVFLVFPVWALILLHRIRRNVNTLLDGQARETPLALPRETESGSPALTALRPVQQPIPPPAPAPAPQPSPLPPPAPAAAPPPPRPLHDPPPLPPSHPAPSSIPVAAAAATRTPPAASRPLPPKPDIESAAAILLRKAWNWIVVGEEFRRQDVTIEFAIASQWLMRIGILILLFGGYFFIKYSIDRGYLGETGRVALSTLAGALMVAGGLHLFGKKYQILGQGFVGGGIALLYFSLYAANVMFHIIGPPAAFAGMALVTLVSAILSVRYRSLLVAMLGLLGGYLTPMLLSTGVKNYPGLYAYLLLLGFGMLGVSWKRQWPIVTWVAFTCHTALVWLSLARDYTPADFTVVMPFLAGFFLLFSTAVFLYNLATRTVASILELIGLLLAATFFFGFGYWVILATWPGQHDRAAWLALGLCAYYVSHVIALQWRGVHDRGLQTIFLGLGAIFLSITLPLLFSNAWLTVTWAMEALVLLWMSQKLGSRILRQLAALIYAILIGRVVFHDMGSGFFTGSAPQDFSTYLAALGPRLIQFLVPVLSLAGAWRLLKSEPPQTAATPEAPETKAYGLVPALALLFTYGILFLYMNFEVYRFCSTLYRPLVHPGLTLVWVGLGALLLAYRRPLGPVAAAILWTLLAAALIGKLMIYDLPAWQIGTGFLYGDLYDAPHVLVRFLNFGLLMAFALVTFRLLRPETGLAAVSLAAGWLAILLLLAYLTLETSSALHAFLPAFEKGGVTVLWTVFACSLVIAGLRNRARALRWFGLALFIVVVVKIFNDLARAEAIYRVIALLSVGVILILASFFYLKYKDRFESR